MVVLLILSIVLLLLAGALILIAGCREESARVRSVSRRLAIRQAQAQATARLEQTAYRAMQQLLDAARPQDRDQ